MNDQDCAHLVMSYLGLKKFHELTIEEHDIVLRVIDCIKENPIQAKLIYDYIDSKDEGGNGDVFSYILDVCGELDVNVDEHIYDLDTCDDNPHAFTILDTPTSSNCCKANIFLNDGENGWCKGEGITNNQRQFLTSLNVKCVRWCKRIDTHCVPKDMIYQKVSSIATIESTSLSETGKEMTAMFISFAALMAVTVGGSIKGPMRTTTQK